MEVKIELTKKDKQKLTSIIKKQWTIFFIYFICSFVFVVLFAGIWFLLSEDGLLGRELEVVFILKVVLLTVMSYYFYINIYKILFVKNRKRILVDVSKVDYITLVDKRSIKILEKGEIKELSYKLEGKKYKARNVFGNTIDILTKKGDRLAIIETSDSRYEIALSLINKKLSKKYKYV